MSYTADQIASAILVVPVGLFVLWLIVRAGLFFYEDIMTTIAEMREDQ